MFLCGSKPIFARILQKCTANIVLPCHQIRLLSISCQVEKLRSRGLIRVSGDDASSFLQGIVTNDMRHFQNGRKCLFTMFLNTKGRVLYDSIIYETNKQNTFILECDYNGVQDLAKHLKMYRVRRKINIDVIDNEFKLWVLFNPKEVQGTTTNNKKTIKQDQVVPCTLPNLNNNSSHTFLNELILSENSLIYSDPRLPNLGSRVIVPEGEDISQLVSSAGVQVVTSPWSYRMFRYRLGVGEGTEELPIGKCFPLEANCDYLHGVSFHKGCYIGQELTARTHHTGVVRKRLMPLVLQSATSLDEIPLDTAIEDIESNKKTAIGKLRGLDKDSALGLMRIAEALETDKFKIKNIEGETLRPFWWPQELSKERLDTDSGKRS